MSVRKRLWLSRLNDRALPALVLLRPNFLPRIKFVRVCTRIVGQVRRALASKLVLLDRV
jgi:hypothetical protein